VPPPLSGAVQPLRTLSRHYSCRFHEQYVCICLPPPPLTCSAHCSPDPLSCC
jgi:hypothetical protein